MTRRASLAGRLSRVLITWIGVVWLCCVLGVTWWVSEAINDNFDSELVEIAHRMLDIAIHDLDQRELEASAGHALIATPPLIPGDAVVFHLVDACGKTLLRAAEAPAQGFAVPLQVGFINAGLWRVYTMRHPSKPLFLQMADPLDERREAVNRALLGLVLPMMAVLPLLGWLILAITRRELAGVRQLGDEIALRGGNDLRPVMVRGLPQELQKVSDDVNRLLERLSAALGVERALAANAAHELRTPLASVRLRLQTALEHGLKRSDIEAALAALATLTHRAEKLLQMSRAESGATLTQEPVDLVRLARMVMGEFTQADQVQRVALAAVEAGVGPALGDIDALAIALRNLIENALRYGRGRVTVKVLAPCTLAVHDGGRGIEPDRLASMLQRHVRQEAGGAGYGLGLSIVRSIADRHGARLVFGDAAGSVAGKDAGFEVRLVLMPAP